MELIIWMSVIQNFKILLNYFYNWDTAYCTSTSVFSVGQTDAEQCAPGPVNSLIIAHREYIRQISLDVPYIVDVVLPIPQLKSARAVDADLKTGETIMLIGIVTNTYENQWRIYLKLGQSWNNSLFGIYICLWHLIALIDTITHLTDVSAVKSHSNLPHRERDFVGKYTGIKLMFWKHLILTSIILVYLIFS